MKRHNAKTNQPYLRGDTREDGFYFLGYQTKTDKKGFFYESWVRPEVWESQTSKDRDTLEKHVRRSLSRIKSRAKRENIPFDLSLDYLMSIVTKECPALKIELAWGNSNGRHSNSPSLDKINPVLGYVPGNVMWLSFMANNMKQNASETQLKKFADWILNGHIGDRKSTNP